jgi:hypothetical protein
MKTNSKEENQRACEEENRPYEVKFGAQTEFAILPGEDPLEFEILRGQLAAEHAPDGPLQEDLVLTLAKFIWRKRRSQRFLAARAAVAQFDPSHELYDESLVLKVFDHALGAAKSIGEIRWLLDRLEGRFADHLKAKCPRRVFPTLDEWVKAMRKEVQEVLMPVPARFSPSDELLIKRSSTLLTDDVFARELEFEERIDRRIEQTLDRLEKVKAAKRPVSFREAQRFSRSHPTRLDGFVK